MASRRTDRGFTLIELLIVVAIIGIIAAILIPNLLDALQKAKQKRTMSDMRSVGLAWMAWLTDQQGAASAGSGSVWNAPDDMSERTLVEISQYLVPSESFFYITAVPAFDAWGNDLRFAMSQTLAIRVLVIGSPGRDGAFAPDFIADRTISPFISTDYNQDILWSDGHFLRWPDSAKR